MVDQVIRVACVLKSGGDYDAEDVDQLRASVERFLPGHPFVCLSDVAVPCDRIPLRRDWPGWWSKMELFAPEIEGDLLYLDLDTVPVGDLKPLAAVGRLTLAADFQNPGYVNSSVMFLPAEARQAPWTAFTRGPAVVMREYGNPRQWGRYGDQGFLGEMWGEGVSRWQDLLPGAVVSYKAQRVAECGIPEGARLVCFHGKPRPRTVDWLSAMLTSGTAANA